MPALDTNILVRYLVQDDLPQLQAVDQFLRKCVSTGEPLFVSLTVLLELEWVLRARYGLPKDVVLKALSDLFSAVELHIEGELAAEIALQLYRTSTADFADCLHVAIAARAEQLPLWTFDKKAARLAGAELLAA